MDCHTKRVFTLDKIVFGFIKMLAGLQTQRHTQALGENMAYQYVDTALTLHIKRFYLGTAGTGSITLDPSEITASVNIQVKTLGWMANADGHRVVPAESNNNQVL